MSEKKQWDVGLPSDDAIREHAYLVARGVRAVALVGHCGSDPMTMLRAATRLEMNAGSGSVIPFVLDSGEGFADVGFAAAKWALDLWEWATKARHQGELPEEHMHRILGLLLGYDVGSIQAHDERCTGRRFDLPASLLCPTEDDPEAV